MSLFLAPGTCMGIRRAGVRMMKMFCALGLYSSYDHSYTLTGNTYTHTHTHTHTQTHCAISMTTLADSGPF